MKKYNVWLPVLLTVVFITAFLLFTFFGNRGEGDHSSAEEAADSIARWKETTSGKNLEFFSAKTTFYNYKYDREIYNNARDQGAQSCYDPIKKSIPFGTFDKKLSEYYNGGNKEQKHVKIGIYTGNFYNYYGGLPGVGTNKVDFPGYYYFKWAANIANRHAPYDSVCQGIVASELSGDTLMTATSEGDTVPVPYFDKDFLTNTKVNGVAIGAVQENVNFPFRKITSGSKEGYYEFDSIKDVVRFQGMTGIPNDSKCYFGNNGTLEYYYNTSFVYSDNSFDASDVPQFFPYNEANTSQDYIDYGFGVRFDIPFYLSSDGKINGKNMVFEFSGDDDVWIFLDGKLALDLGGQHGKATGTIDFGGSQSTARATVDKVTRINNSSNPEDTAKSDKILESDTYIQSSVSKNIDNVQKGNHIDNKHVITVFYMERGMFESNFHMAFNFVPGETPPAATEEPKPVEPENPTEKANGSLTIQNKMVFPKDDKDKINGAFLDTVKDLAEDDIFQYSIQNQGTNKDQVGENDANYPSGKLTVRKNGKDGAEKTSYLSFGANPKVRIYFDIGKVRELISAKKFDWLDNVDYKDAHPLFKFPLSEDGSNDIQLANDITCNGGSIASDKKKLIKYTDGIYYIDCIPNKDGTTTEFKFQTKHCAVGSQQITFVCQLTFDYYINGNTPINLREYDGMLIQPTKLLAKNDAIIVVYKDKQDSVGYTTIPDDGSGSHPALGGSGTVDYSSGLPYQNEGTVKYYFDPSKGENVVETSFKLREDHLAPTRAPGSTDTIKIKKNEEYTSGCTDENGLFDLFYDDSATFENQFITGSLMKVEQNDNLRKPVRYTGTLSEDMKEDEVKNALTTFDNRTQDDAIYKPRSVSNYYYTTESGTEGRNVGYDGQYYFKNVNNENTTVNITQTFTNTVKTGSLIISKELKGNMDEDSKHEYGFKVTFSNVFGGGSSDEEYSGSYTMVDKAGTTTSKSAVDSTTGIVLKPGEKAIISGIPVGTSYKIEETGRTYIDANGNSRSDDGSVLSDIQTSYVATTEDDTITSPEYHEAWDNTNKVGDSNVEEINKTTKTITGTIPCSIVNKLYDSETNLYSEVEVSVKFTNQLGALTITKQISGDVNNVSYYTDSPKTYTFTVKDNKNPTDEIKYVVYTYTYIDANTPPIVTKSAIQPATNGKIVLEEGQKAEIGGISLTDSKTYTIQEEVGDKDIYFVEEAKVTSGTKDTSATTGTSDTGEHGLVKKVTIGDTTTNETYNISTYNTSITTKQFTGDAPTFDVIFNNRYSNAYLTIDKYVDAAYGSDKKYSNDQTYQEMTNAKQSFIFNVKQYKTLDEAKDGTKTPENSFDIVLTMGQDNDKEYEKKTDDAKEKIDSKICKYKLSKTVKVLANRYYRIEEDTNWSWKYALSKVVLEDNIPNITNAKSIIGEKDGKKYVILKTYLDEFHELEQKRNAKYVPIAKFYNLLDSSKTDIEGDTDNIPNKIKQK